MTPVPERPTLPRVTEAMCCVLFINESTAFFSATLDRPVTQLVTNPCKYAVSGMQEKKKKVERAKHCCHKYLQLSNRSVFTYSQPLMIKSVNATPSCNSRGATQVSEASDELLVSHFCASCESRQGLQRGEGGKG